MRQVCFGTMAPRCQGGIQVGEAWRVGDGLGVSCGGAESCCGTARKPLFPSHIRSGGGKGSRTPDLLNAISQQSKDDRRQGATEPHFSGLSDLLIFHEPHLPYCMHYVCLKPPPHPRQGNRITLLDASAIHSSNPASRNISLSCRHRQRSHSSLALASRKQGAKFG